MTETEQNILIAEACGWVPETVIVLVWRCESVREGVAIGEYQDQNQILYSKDGHQFRPENLPHYNSCLNAMHEAELTLSPEQRREYLRILAGVTLASDCLEQAVFATAAQRAEALLRIKGKWKQAS